MNSRERLSAALNRQELHRTPMGLASYCGNVRPAIPDPVEMGVQILNPVHDIEADVPLENLSAMRQAWQGHGAYP
jgi:hypothetical protein